MTPTEQLYESLTPEQIEPGLFRAPAGSIQIGHLFGGQVMAQALSAASRTVPDKRYAHSLHAYFLRSGDEEQPVVFYVESLRDGGSFSTRHVVAKQNGKAILNVSVSFKLAEAGFEHQTDAPDVSAPSSLPSDVARREAAGLSGIYAEIDPFSTFEFRTVGALPEQVAKGDSDRQGFWLKAVAPAVESVLMQQCLLAYVSDYRLMGSAMKPHGLGYWEDNVQSASLDHTIWFHHPFQFDGWLYYDLDGPVSADARGLNFGRFFDSEGRLIASTAQEALMRVR